MTTKDEERDKLLERAMARHHHSGDALIEVLHAAQQLYGYLSPPLLKTIARKLMLPPSRVLGVATFYHLFRFVPPGKHTATVCVGTACYAAGGQALLSELEQKHLKGWSIEAGRCVGSCGLAPNMICDGAVLARVDNDRLNALIEEKSHDC